MVLKKQTVWLLTMLSLMLVLGIYYVSMETQERAGSPETEEVVDLGDTDEASTDEAEQITAMSGNESMTEARLKRDVDRSKESEDYIKEATNEESSAEEKVEANDKSLEVLAITQVERELETTLIEEGYEDVFVRTDSAMSQVHITVQSSMEESSRTEALTIMSMAREKLSLSAEAEILVKFEK